MYSTDCLATDLNDIKKDEMIYFECALLEPTFNPQEIDQGANRMVMKEFFFHPSSFMRGSSQGIRSLGWGAYS